MKFRALNVNYYIEADASANDVASRMNRIRIKVAPYLQDKLCTEQSNLSKHALLLDSNLIVPLPTKAFTPLVHSTHNEKNVPSSLSTLMHCDGDKTLAYQHDNISHCHSETVLTSTIAIKQNRANSMIYNLLLSRTNDGISFFDLVSYMLNYAVYIGAKKTIAENSGEYARDTMSRIHQKRIIQTAACSEFAYARSTASKAQVMRNDVEATDAGTLVSLRATSNVSVENYVLSLAQFIIALIQNRQLWLSILFLCNDPVVATQIEKQHSTTVTTMSDKRKRHVDCSCESKGVKKRPLNDDSLSHNHNKSRTTTDSLTVQVINQPEINSHACDSDQDCSTNIVVEKHSKKKPKSDRKNRKVKRKRDERRILKSEVNQTSGPMPHSSKSKTAPESVIYRGEDQALLQPNIEPIVVMNKTWKLGDVDIELNTARSNMNYKALRSRDAFAIAKTMIPQGAAKSSISGKNLIPWNKCRQENKESPYSRSEANQNNHLQNSDISSTTKSVVVTVECQNSLRQNSNTARLWSNDPCHEIRTHNCNINRFSGQPVASDKLTTKKLPSTTETDGNNVGATIDFQEQSTGENPIQRSRDRPTIEVKQRRLSTETTAHHSQFRQRTVLCSEAFLESWGDVVATIASGEWMSPSSFGGPYELTEKTNASSDRRKINVLDSPILNGSGIDIEASSSCCLLIISALLLQSTEKAKEFVLKLAKLAALGRYTKCYIFFYLDASLSPAMTKNMIKIQFATAASPVHVLCKTTTFNNLAASLAQTILSLPEPHQIDDRTDVIKDRLTLDRVIFLISLLPVASIGGSIRCVTLAKSLLPMGSPYFDILLKNQRLRQKMMITILCRESNDALNPKILIQLSFALELGQM